METPGVLESTRPVVEGARSVRIDRPRLEELCREWARDPFPVPPWDESVHWSDGGQATANHILVLDALNFCFWPDPGEVRWTTEYRGERVGGYRALAASLKRAAEEGIPVHDAAWLGAVTEGDLEHVFRGEGRIPLFERRVAHAREVGRVLQERYGGEFSHAIDSCGGSAVRLVHLLEREFSSFRDLATWQGRPVRLLKRAQITVVDLYGAFGGTRWGAFHDLDALTAFADYKIPQVLRALGVMVYEPDLADRVDRRDLLEAGSEEEVEIRAAMIWAVEWIREALATQGVARRPFELDWFLWNLGQKPVPDERPYHRTRTHFY